MLYNNREIVHHDSMIYHTVRRDFSTAAPVRIYLRHHDAAQNQYKADFCIISRRDGDFDWFPLIEDPLVALVSEEHPLAAHAFVTVEDLRREAFIMLNPQVETDCSIYLRQHCVEPNVRFSCRDTFALYDMVEAGLGIAVDNAIFAASIQSGVRALPLDPPQMIDIGITAPHREQLSPAASIFLSMAKRWFSFS